MKNKVGRFEKISFPELDIDMIEAKVDTGAYGIALHVDGIEVVDDKLNFWINEESNKFTYDKYKVITVKSSFGRIQKRYSVRTQLKLGEKSYKVFVSLTDRKSMKFPCLIGRRFLYKFNYLVDVRKKNIHDRDKKV